MVHPLSKRKSSERQDATPVSPTTALPPAMLSYPHHVIPVLYHYLPVPSPPLSDVQADASRKSRDSSSPSRPSPILPKEYSYISPQLLPQPFALHTSTADEREQARRVSHSAIEKRRRERINDKIMQLKQLIPSCADQGNLHKMSILQSAIDYIAYLKDVVQELDDGDHDTLCSRHMHVQTIRSMLPKEVEPFTSQFSIKKPSVATARVPKKQKSPSPPSPPVTSDLPTLHPPIEGSPDVATDSIPFKPESPPAGKDDTALDQNTQPHPVSGKHMSLKNLLC